MIMRPLLSSSLFFFHDTAPTGSSTLSLHDALPISEMVGAQRPDQRSADHEVRALPGADLLGDDRLDDRPVVQAIVKADRKSTRLNSSHQIISYAVFCLKKKKQSHLDPRHQLPPHPP